MKHETSKVSFEEVVKAYKNVGVFHNKVLHEYLEERPSDADINEFFIKKVIRDKNLLFESDYSVEELINKEGFLQADTLEEVEKKQDVRLSDLFKKTYQKIESTIEEGTNVKELKSELDSLSKAYFSELEVDYEKFALIAMIEVGKASFEYWTTNLEKWKSTINNEIIQGKKVHPVAKADAQGAAMGAVTGAIGGALWGGPVGAFAFGIYSSATTCSARSTIAAVKEVAKGK